MEIVIGIDIGGTNTKLGLIDNQGNSLGETHFETQETNEKFEDYVDNIALHIKDLVSKQGEIKIKGIGIGAPNGNYYKGTIEYAPNLKWKGILPLADTLKKKTGIQNIKLTNDANAAALGEMTFGAAREMKDFIVITLGTGLGSGIVTGGKLLLGHDGFAGEIGHVTIIEDGRQCGCGRQGCLETYVSATGIVRTVTQLLAKSNEPSLLREIPFAKLTAKQISEAALQNDPIAKKAFECTGKYLGMAMANSVAYLSPEAIILFGGLAKAGDLLLIPFREHFEKNLMGIYKNKVKILISGLNDGVSAAILGASSIIWKDI